MSEFLIICHFLQLSHILIVLECKKIIHTFQEICNMPSGTLLKEQGSTNLVQNMGHKGPVLRPRCIRPGRA